ncbi:hypothetical protein FACS1894199_03110 [Bacteroidia bacterium]|nr:hypothetical protein FACS1894199_03110 [Bacteroidia bacterium]
MCAHHERIWNRKLRIQPLLPQKTDNIWLENKTVSNNCMFYVLSTIIYLLNTVNPRHTFKQKLAYLFNKFPDADKRAMGFPENWERESLWK